MGQSREVVQSLGCARSVIRRTRNLWWKMTRGEGIYPRWGAKRPHYNLPDTPRRLVLGLLRNPAGINPLAIGMQCASAE